MTYATHRQTKNALISPRVVSVDTSAPVEYGSIVSFQGSEIDGVSLHDGTDLQAGVVYTGREGDVFEVGDCIDVQRSGTAVVKAAVAITKGDVIASDASGQAIVHVPGTTAKIGVAEKTVPAGEYFSVLLATLS